MKTVRWMWTILGLLVAAPGRAAPVDAEGPLEFEGFLLTLPGKVTLTFYEDIDGDGLLDALVVYTDEGSRARPRNLVVFFQRPTGFLAEPDLTYRVPDDVSLIDLGDVTSRWTGRELVMLSGSDVRWRPLVRGETAADAPAVAETGEVLLVVDSVFAAADEDRLDKRDFAREIDGSDRATLFLPRTSGYRVAYPVDDYASPQDFEVHHVHRVQRETYRVRPATLHLADLDGDGHDDLVITHLDRLQVHLQRNERFAPAPDLDLDLQILTDLDREAPEPIENLIGFEVQDFDGDSLADIFLWKTMVRKKAVVNDKKQYQLFRNKGGYFAMLPDQAFILKSFDEPDVLDLDGDGRLDFVTGYFEFSLGNIIKALISKRFGIELSFFLGGPQGFPDQPDEKRDFKIRISLSNMDENFQPAVEIEGDYDGDERLDFLLQSEDEKIEIFLASPEDGRLFEKNASVKLKVPACNNAFVGDFNGDGKDDMAFDRYPDREPFDPHWVQIVLSR